LLATATVTNRAGFFASSPTIQSRKAPLPIDLYPHIHEATANT
jgi:hypothetical protein